MGSMIGHRIDYNGVGGSERPAAHTQQKLTQVPPRESRLHYLFTVLIGPSSICLAPNFSVPLKALFNTG